MKVASNNLAAWRAYGSFIKARMREKCMSNSDLARRVSDAGVPLSGNTVRSVLEGDISPRAEIVMGINWVLYGDAMFPGVMIPTAMTMGLWKEGR